MTLNYLTSRRTDGANAFNIFEFAESCDPDDLRSAIRGLSYGVFLRSAYWFAVSMVAKSRAGMRCQVCNSGRGIQAHHRTYDTHGAEHLHMNDLAVLCENCHGLFHGHKTTTPNFKEAAPVARRIDTAMPPSDCEVVLTKDLLNNCRAGGTFTNATIRAFGVSRGEMTRGWAKALIGRSISKSAYAQAVQGRLQKNSGKLQ